jgi:hypothetical protein
MLIQYSFRLFVVVAIIWQLYAASNLKFASDQLKGSRISLANSSWPADHGGESCIIFLLIVFITNFNKILLEVNLL